MRDSGLSRSWDTLCAAGRCGGFSCVPVPRQQRVELVVLDGFGDDALKHIGQPGQRIDIIQSTSFNLTVWINGATIAPCRPPLSPDASPARRCWCPSSTARRRDSGQSVLMVQRVAHRLRARCGRSSRNVTQGWRTTIPPAPHKPPPHDHPRWGGRPPMASTCHSRDRQNLQRGSRPR